MTSNKIAAVIPARMASTRYPGKPLLVIEGLPMIEHARRRALLCQKFSEVVVATCDQKIADCIQSHGGKVILTSPTHHVATERIVEACNHLDCTHVVNVQGDEVLVLPEDLNRLVQAINQNPAGPVWNAIAAIENQADREDPSIVKCLLSKGDRLLFCSRHFSFATQVFQVVGILAYTCSLLKNFNHLKPTPLEKRESIEQLRFLEHDLPIQGVRFAKSYPGINTPAEAQKVKVILQNDPQQQAILKQIL